MSLPMVSSACDGRVECVACFQTTDACVLPCWHPMCRTCAETWFRGTRMSCPTCRQPPAGLFVGEHMHKREASLCCLGRAGEERGTDAKYGSVAVISLATTASFSTTPSELADDAVGRLQSSKVRFEERHTRSGMRLRVSKSGDLAGVQLRRGDEIISMNNLSVHSVAALKAIWARARSHKIPIILLVRKPTVRERMLACCCG